MPSPRVDLYGPIHQGIRRMLYETAIDIGATDFRSDAETEQCLGAVEHALELLNEHASIEDESFHPALEERAPGATLDQEAQHEEQHAVHQQRRREAAHLTPPRAPPRTARGPHLGAGSHGPRAVGLQRCTATLGLESNSRSPRRPATPQPPLAPRAPRPAAPRPCSA